MIIGYGVFTKKYIKKENWFYTTMEKEKREKQYSVTRKETNFS